MRLPRASRRLRYGATIAAVGLVLPWLTGAADAAAVRFTTYESNYVGGEPTIGVLRDGSLVAQALTVVIKSRNRGRNWTPVKDTAIPKLADPRSGDEIYRTLDPYIHVDAVTGRIFSSQLYGACQLISISDDSGESWVDLPTQCGTGDHQKLGTGAWRNPSNKPYPRSVYTCMNHVADTACAISVDGGTTWTPPIVVFPGIDPLAGQGLADIPGLCGGLEGDPVSAPDGTLYLPREYCGRPFLGVSTDDGLTWERRYVAAPAQTRPFGFGANNPAVTVADDGAVFYTWTGADFRHYVARSRDRGVTWSKPWRVSPPDVGSTTFPLIVAGRAGAVATAFIGTRGGSGKSPDEVPKDSRWHVFISYTLNGNAASPKWVTQRVTRDPVMPGCVSRHGVNCSPDNDALLDFNDIALDTAGRIVVVYGDACPRGCKKPTASKSAAVSVAVQSSGPRLR